MLTHKERVILQHSFDQYQGVELGYGLDDIHNFLFADFDRLPAIVVPLGGQRLGPRSSHPVMPFDGRQRDPGIRVLVKESVQQVHQLRGCFRFYWPLHRLRADLLVHRQYRIRGVRQPTVDKRIQRAP